MILIIVWCYNKFGIHSNSTSYFILEIHHIIPTKKGGGDNPENLEVVTRAVHLLRCFICIINKWGKKLELSVGM